MIFTDHLLFTVPKALNKLPAITTGRDQLYIPVAPPLAHVGYLCGVLMLCTSLGFELLTHLLMTF